MRENYGDGRHARECGIRPVVGRASSMKYQLSAHLVDRTKRRRERKYHARLRSPARAALINAPRYAHHLARACGRMTRRDIIADLRVCQLIV